MRVEAIFVRDEEPVDKIRYNNVENINELIEELKKEYENTDFDYIDIFVEKQLPCGERYFEYYYSIVL